MPGEVSAPVDPTIWQPGTRIFLTSRGFEIVENEVPCRARVFLDGGEFRILLQEVMEKR